MRNVLIKIQKYLKGYVVWNKIGRKNRLNSTLKYFENLRNKEETDTQIKLAYHFRKYQKKKQQKFEQKEKEDQIKEMINQKL